MTDAFPILEEAGTRARWRNFALTEADAAEIERVITHYPLGRQHSTIMPLLGLAHNRTSPIQQEVFHG